MNAIVLQALIESLTTDTFKKLIEAGAVVYHHKHIAEELFYIPAGWMVAEIVKKGLVLYGLRKNIFFQHKDFMKTYSAAVDLLQKADRNVDKMEQVKQLATEVVIPPAS